MPLGWFLSDTWRGYALLVGSILVLIMVEVLNTGIEASCDAVSQEFDIDIQLAKDCGSLAVLISVVLAIGVWGLRSSRRFRGYNSRRRVLHVGYQRILSMTDSTMLELERRNALPDDLRFLAEKYPRDDWQAHANIHGMANMWLQRHDMFRELGGIADRGSSPTTARAARPRRNSRSSSRRASTSFSAISTATTMSRTITISRSSPRAEPRLKRGFDILDGDHHTIHEGLRAQCRDGQCLPEGAAWRRRRAAPRRRSLCRRQYAAGGHARRGISPTRRT